LWKVKSKLPVPGAVQSLMLPNATALLGASTTPPELVKVIVDWNAGGGPSGSTVTVHVPVMLRAVSDAAAGVEHPPAANAAPASSTPAMRTLTRMDLSSSCRAPLAVETSADRCPTVPFLSRARPRDVPRVRGFLDLESDTSAGGQAVLENKGCRASCVRDVRPSLRNTAPRWNSTVLTERNNRSAASWFVMPSATARPTRSS